MNKRNIWLVPRARRVNHEPSSVRLAIGLHEKAPVRVVTVARHASRLQLVLERPNTAQTSWLGSKLTAT